MLSKVQNTYFDLTAGHFTVSGKEAKSTLPLSAGVICLWSQSLYSDIFGIFLLRGMHFLWLWGHFLRKMRLKGYR